MVDVTSPPHAGRRRFPGAPLAALLGALILLAACFPLPEDAPGEEPDAAAAPENVQAALTTQATADLATRLDVEPAAIQITSIEAVEWGDSSLGCPEEGMIYAAVVTPGYRIRLNYNGVEYVYHTGATAAGPVINCPQESVAPPPETETPNGETQVQLVLRATQEMAEQLGVDPETITVAAIEEMMWGDSSLGCPQPDMVYAQVITPGYRITLRHEEVEYVYHTGAEADSPVIHCTDGSPAEDETVTAAGGGESAPGLSARDALVARAMQDLAQRQGMDRSVIQVKSVRGVEWNDGSLGCPSPGMMYPQVITPGYRIILTADGVDYAYHTGRSADGPLKYCARPTKSDGGDDQTR